MTAFSPTGSAQRALRPGQSATVEVPATSANLGPGFDCFGLAIDWRETIRLDVIESGYRIEVTGESADHLPRDESHLIMRSALVGLADLGSFAPGLRLTCHNTIPHGRGLGSSSAAIVAGLAAAHCLVTNVAAGCDGAGQPSTSPQLDREWLLRHADAIEGHPDNVAAAIYGGFVIAYDGSPGSVAQATVAGGLQIVLFVPETPVGTSAARRLLPDQVPHGDAAANSGRAALLVHALAFDHSRLWDATRDWLHQDYRQRAMPASYELMKALRGRGHAAVISGAGPAVLVLAPLVDVESLQRFSAPGFRIIAAAVGSGARIVGAQREE